MTQFYSRHEDTHNPWRLPDCEVFYITREDILAGMADEGSEPGYYYWYCFPGCMPEGEPIGPFDTEENAIKDCQENAAC